MSPSDSLGPPVQLRFDCECGALQVVQIAPAEGAPESLECSRCEGTLVLEAGRLDGDGGLFACQLCGHPELFSKKDVPRALGLMVVAVAAVLAPWTNYASLAVAAVIDFALYRCMPDVLVCYECQAEHRGYASEPRHPGFDREIAERLAFGKRAVMGKPMRAGGTAGAPEPEH
ncbi:MAG: hypothetical protein ABGY71_09250 [bacterium]|jgi:hypothetical protein|nr:hypothetical protein [Planctomycetota bacterium]HIL52530.1 hypothetical protein [Planctomycetota bacterium]